MEYSKPGKAAIKATEGKSGKSVGFKADQEAYNDKPVIKWPVPDPTNTSKILGTMMSHKTDPAEAMRHRTQQEHNSTDAKMNAFLDEMRQQFMQTQNVNVIPQSLMYRQTQLMESQVQMLEQNQKQMGEVINNVMNQQATGHESGASLKQNIFNENRRMMLEMMVPLN